MKLVPVLAASAWLAVACAARAQPISDPAQGWAAMLDCARHHQNEARRDCTDQVLRRAGALPAPVAQALPTPRPARPPPFRSAPEGERKGFGLEPPPPTEPVDAILSEASMDGEGRLVLVTSEGAVWRAVEINPRIVAPRPGQAITITKGALGGYECKLSRWVSILCQRVR